MNDKQVAKAIKYNIDIFYTVKQFKSVKDSINSIFRDLEYEFGNGDRQTIADMCSTEEESAEREFNEFMDKVEKILDTLLQEACSGRLDENE